MSSILIVCTGNICRSPMAEGLLDHYLRDRGIRSVRVESAGVIALEGSPPVAEIAEAAQERGLDISAHVARRLEREMVGRADLVVAMAAEHREAVRRIDQQAGDRTFTLKELVNVLDDFPGSDEEAGPEERLSAAVRWAGEHRWAADPVSGGEDVADPLGLSLMAYQATAWELDGLIERLADELFRTNHDTEVAIG